MNKQLFIRCPKKKSAVKRLIEVFEELGWKMEQKIADSHDITKSDFGFKGIDLFKE